MDERFFLLVRMYVCMYACMYIYVCVCVRVCMRACMYVCMHVSVGHAGSPTWNFFILEFEVLDEMCG
jgi:hypothetical protein